MLDPFVAAVDGSRDFKFIADWLPIVYSRNTHSMGDNLKLYFEGYVMIK